MKIACLCNDEVLRMKFMEDHNAEEDLFLFFDKPEQLMAAAHTADWQYVVVSDRCFSLAILEDFLEGIKDKTETIHVIVLLSNRHDQLINEKFLKFCLSEGYDYTLPGQTVSSIVREVNQLIHAKEGIKAKKRNNLVLFLGSTPNIGTTLTAFGTALQLAEGTDRQIAYLCLNLKSSKIHVYLGESEPTTSLDGLRAELRSNSLTKAGLIHHCHKVREHSNLHVLFGNQLREQAEYYTAEDIRHLLDIAVHAFDLCLVEVNAYWDNAATICAVQLAGTRILVTTPQLGHFQEDVSAWLKNLSPMLELSEDGFDVFITQHSGRKTMGEQGTFSDKEIMRSMGLNVIGRMGNYAKVDAMLNQGRIIELMSDDAIKKELAGLAHILSVLYELRMEKAEASKKWWVYKLFFNPTKQLNKFS